MRGMLIAAAAGLLSVAPALGQCTSGTTPIRKTVAGHSVGAAYLAVNGDWAAVDLYDVGNRYVRIYRRDAAGWTFDRMFYTDVNVHDLDIHSGVAVATNSAARTVHVYKRNDTTGDWSLAQNIVGSSTSAFYGYSIALTGSQLFIASRGSSPRVEVRSIAATGVTSPLQTINDPVAGTHTFGYDISCDGEWLAISAIGDDTSGPQAGAVYVYRWIAGSWQFVQKLIPPPSTDEPHFGQSVSIHGGRLAVGSTHTSVVDFDVINPNFINGYVRVFEWNGSSFELVAHFTHPTRPAGTPSGFGHDVALRGDRMLVGAIQDSLTGTGAGSIFTYKRDNGVWQPSGVVGLTPGASGWFGTAVALTDDEGFGIAPLWVGSGQALDFAVFDRCVLPPAAGDSPRCIPGIAGLMSFLIAFFQNDPAADFNQDTIVNATDIFQYLRAWFAGCP